LHNISWQQLFYAIENGLVVSIAAELSRFERFFLAMFSGMQMFAFMLAMRNWRVMYVYKPYHVIQSKLADLL
jgi:hypothetical protein